MVDTVNVAWRIEQALEALIDWREPESPETRRTAAVIQAVLVPAMREMHANPRLAGILHEVIYFAAQAERSGIRSCPRQRINDLLYLAQDHIGQQMIAS